MGINGHQKDKRRFLILRGLIYNCKINLIGIYAPNTNNAKVFSKLTQEISADWCFEHGHKNIKAWRMDNYLWANQIIYW